MGSDITTPAFCSRRFFSCKVHTGISPSICRSGHSFRKRAMGGQEPAPRGQWRTEAWVCRAPKYVSTVCDAVCKGNCARCCSGGRGRLWLRRELEQGGEASEEDVVMVSAEGGQELVHLFEGTLAGQDGGIRCASRERSRQNYLGCDKGEGHVEALPEAL